MSAAVINLVYLTASVLFILGLRGLTHPRTAVRGNVLGALGMLLAIVVTLFDRQVVGWGVIAAGLLVGSAVGAVLAVKIRMTAMPQLVALFNGFGGGASVLVAWTASLMWPSGQTLPPGVATATAASGLVGAVTFWGSLVAFAKLQELLSDRLTRFPHQQAVNIAVAAVTLACTVWAIASPDATGTYALLVLTSSVLGTLVVMPIGGADMPVIIAFLNSLSGLAAAATGFVLDNSVLIIAGSLVGASGVILTQIMCHAMNRSLGNVLFGAVGGADAGPSADDVYEGKIKATSPEEVAILLEAARRVFMVPGYGLAVAQAQYAVRDLANLLEQRGVQVDYAIHPVAGRMPGHMNVLLAEANVPYDRLKEMDEANAEMEQADVVLVIGANDVVNPMARTVPDCPIAGMPIIEVDKARTVVVVKRSLSPGFAGIPNPLFAADNTLMLFGDAKKALMELVAALREA